jgi:hypothetical protein
MVSREKNVTPGKQVDQEWLIQSNLGKSIPPKGGLLVGFWRSKTLDKTGQYREG